MSAVLVGLDIGQAMLCLPRSCDRELSLEFLIEAEAAYMLAALAREEQAREFGDG